MEVNPSNTPPVEQTPFIPPHANTYKKALFVVLSISLLGIACVLYLNNSRKIEHQAATKPTEAVCTQDAMICPDGSTVGRSGPDCKFVCPESSTANTAKNKVYTDPKLGYILEYGSDLTFLDTVPPAGFPGLQNRNGEILVRIESIPRHLKTEIDSLRESKVALLKLDAYDIYEQIIDDPVNWRDIEAYKGLVTPTTHFEKVYAYYIDLMNGSSLRIVGDQSVALQVAKSVRVLVKSAESQSSNTLLKGIRTQLGEDKWRSTDFDGKGKCEPSDGAVPDQPELIFDVCIENFAGEDPVPTLENAGWKIIHSYTGTYEGVSYPSTKVMKRDDDAELIYIVKMIGKGTTIIQTAKESETVIEKDMQLGYEFVRNASLRIEFADQGRLHSFKDLNNKTVLEIKHAQADITALKVKRVVIPSNPSLEVHEHNYKSTLNEPRYYFLNNGGILVSGEQENIDMLFSSFRNYTFVDLPSELKIKYENFILKYNSVNWTKSYFGISTSGSGTSDVALLSDQILFDLKKQYPLYHSCGERGPLNIIRCFFGASKNSTDITLFLNSVNYSKESHTLTISFHE